MFIISENINLLNAINENFSLKSHKCTFSIKQIEELSGNKLNSLFVTAKKNEPLYYAFSGNDGVCRTRKEGGIENVNLLKKIIALSNKDAKETLDFFEQNGFLFPLKSEINTPIVLQDMIEVLDRVKTTTLLLNALETSPLDYLNILNYTLLLLLGKQVQIDIPNITSYHTPQNPVVGDIARLGILFGTNATTLVIDDLEYYNIKDTIYPDSFNFRVDEYEDISSGETFTYNYPGISNSLYRQITNAYVSRSLSTNKQHIVDFLFHFMNKVGVMKSVTFDNGIEFYKEGTSIDLDTNMHKALINVSKMVLSYEINYHIRKMQPLYNPNKLEPMWKAPSLLVALYFSVFFLKPSSQIYKKCANPSCKNYFTVKTTNGRKKFCCDHCRGASNSRDHRKRKKNNEKNTAVL